MTKNPIAIEKNFSVTEQAFSLNISSRGRNTYGGYKLVETYIHSEVLALASLTTISSRVLIIYYTTAASLFLKPAL